MKLRHYKIYHFIVITFVNLVSRYCSLLFSVSINLNVRVIITCNTCSSSTTFAAISGTLLAALLAVSILRTELLDPLTRLLSQ